MSSLPILAPVRAALAVAREALYVSVGAGVLTVQRAQVQRREWGRELNRRFAGPARPEPG